MSLQQIQDFQDESGKHRWRIVVLPPKGAGADDEVAPHIIATSQGYDTRRDMLTSFFSVFFGSYDDSYLAMYNEWHPQGDGGVPSSTVVGDGYGDLAVTHD